MAQDFARKLYASKAWRDFRFNLIIERGPKCQRCGAIILDTSMLIGHHTIILSEANINDPTITLNRKHVELICFDCHNKEHKRYGYNNHSVFIIYGSPLSGKTTLVNQLSTYGDIILNIDKLYECISGQVLYDKPNNLRFNVFALRDKMLDMIRTRYGDWYDAYIIGGYPNKFERERLARELGGELIYCEGTKEDCIKRTAALKGDWIKYVDKWWSEYS